MGDSMGGDVIPGGGGFISDPNFDPNRKPPPVRVNLSLSGKKSVFRISLSAFQLISRESNRWPGKKLRFTLTWFLPSFNELTGETEEIGQDEEGCLARIDNTGTLVWSTPQSRSGSYYRQIIFSTPALYNRVKFALENTQFMDLLKKKNFKPNVDPTDINPDLPKELDV